MVRIEGRIPKSLYDEIRKEAFERHVSLNVIINESLRKKYVETNMIVEGMPKNHSEKLLEYMREYFIKQLEPISKDKILGNSIGLREEGIINEIKYCENLLLELKGGLASNKSKSFRTQPSKQESVT